MSASLDETENFALGTGVAVFEGLLLQPTMYWKNARQQGMPFTLDPRLLYRGLGAALSNEVAQVALQFTAVGRLKSILGDGVGEMGAAAAGGAIVALVASPIELVMIQQQRHGGTLLGTPMRIIRERGLFGGGLMRGLGYAMQRDALYVGGMLGAAPVAQRWFAAHYFAQKGGGDSGGVGAALAGSVVGALAGATLSHPFDVVKTCMQGDIERKTYGANLPSARLLFRDGGIGRFFQGVGWRGFNILVTVYIATEACERLPRHVRRLFRGPSSEPAAPAT